MKDKIKFFAEYMDEINFVIDKEGRSLDLGGPSGLTWQEVIILMSEYYDTHYEKYPDIDRDYVD